MPPAAQIPVQTPMDQAKEAATKLDGATTMVTLPKRTARFFLKQGSSIHVNALAEMLMERESSSPKIASMLRAMGVTESPDTFPWCATSTSFALTRAGIKTSIASARAFLNYGTETSTPSYGDLVVMWNTNPATGGRNGWGGHVGFYLGEVDGANVILSGNAEDMVTVALYSKDRVLAYRTPPKAPAPALAKVKYSLPRTVTGVVKTTEALKNSLPAMPSKIAEYLKESTYLSEVGPKNLEVVEKAIGAELAAATDSSDFLAIESSLGKHPFSEPQRVLAQAVIGVALNKRVADLDALLAKSPSSAGFALRKTYEDKAQDVWRRVQDVLSGAGQLLSIGNMIRELVNPRTTSRVYRDALAHPKLGDKLPTGADETFAELEGQATEAAKVAVKKSPVIKKVLATVAKTDEAKAVAEVLEVIQDQLDRGTGIPIPAKMADWVAGKIFAMVQSRVKGASGETEKTFFEEYSDEVRRMVEARFKSVLAAGEPTKAPATPAEREARKQAALRKGMGELASFFSSEFAPSVEAAFNQSKARLLARLEPGKDASPEALKRYAEMKDSISKMTLDYVPLQEAVGVVRKAFDMREELYLTVADRNANIASLATMISSIGKLTAEQSAKVAEAIKAAYESEFNRRAETVLQNYTNRALKQGIRAAERPSRTERFLRLVRLGGLRKEEFYNAMAEEFGLPSYDPAVAEELDREAERIDSLPMGSVQRNDAVQDLNARVVNEVHKAMFRARDFLNPTLLAEYLLRIPVSMWKAGVLSGFGTIEVNAGAGFLQNIIHSGTLAASYGIKSRSPALVLRNLGVLAKTLTVLFDAPTRKETLVELKRAMFEGRTRFGSEQSESMLVLERDIPLPDVPVVKQLMSAHKRFLQLQGRLVSIVDSTVAVPASIARQRLALDYMLTLKGVDRASAERILKDSFTPSEMESREIEAILESEKDQFAYSPRPDLVRESRRAQLLAQRRERIYDSLADGVPAKDRENYMEASRQSARFANLSTRPTGIAGLIFDGFIGQLERRTGGLTAPIISFVRSTGNMLDFSLGMSVLGLPILRALNISPSNLLPDNNRYRRDRIEPGSVEYHQQMMLGLVSGLLQVGILAAYSAGLDDELEGREPWFFVYGRGYPDPEKNRQLKARDQKWAPYTMKIGGWYIPWKDIPGLNLFLGALAWRSDTLMANSTKDMEKVRDFDIAVNTAVGFVKALTVKQSFSGVSRLAELFSESTVAEATQGRQLTRVLMETISPPINTRLLRDLVDMGRGLAAGGEYAVMDSRAQETTLASILPGNAVYSDALGVPKMVNVLGRPVTEVWYSPLVKRFAPTSVSDSYDPIVTPLVSAGLFISPVDPAQMSFKTYRKNDPTKIDNEGGNLRAFDPSVEREAIMLFGSKMTQMLTPDVIKSLTDQAAKGRAEREDAQDRLNKYSSTARRYAKDVLQKRIFNREIKPHWQE